MDLKELSPNGMLVTVGQVLKVISLFDTRHPNSTILSLIPLDRHPKVGVLDMEIQFSIFEGSLCLPYVAEQFCISAIEPISIKNLSALIF